MNHQEPDAFFKFVMHWSPGILRCLENVTENWVPQSPQVVTDLAYEKSHCSGFTMFDPPVSVTRKCNHYSHLKPVGHFEKVW